MGISGHSAGIGFEVTAPEMRKLLLAAKDFDKHLATSLRRDLRIQGKTTAEKVRAATMGGDYKRDVGLRREIAEGIGVGISTSEKRPGIVIRDSSKALPESKKHLIRLFQKKGGWRAPAFGDKTGDWHVIKGNQAFYKTVAADRPRFTQAVTKAMQDAARVMAKQANG